MHAHAAKEKRAQKARFFAMQDYRNKLAALEYPFGPLRAAVVVGGSGSGNGGWGDSYPDVVRLNDDASSEV